MQKVAIEEDLPEYADDRGHSAHHPGYRRRQLRFLVMKIFSQLSAYVYFLTLVPVLRYGPNNRRFPFSEVVAGTQEKPATLLLSDTLLDESLQFLVQKRFVRAMYFAGAPPATCSSRCLRPPLRSVTATRACSGANSVDAPIRPRHLVVDAQIPPEHHIVAAQEVQRGAPLPPPNGALATCRRRRPAVRRAARRAPRRRGRPVERRKCVQVVVNTAHYGLVLNILLVNCLIGTSFVNIYYRIYFV